VIAAIVLAAGSARRFGEQKLLVPLHGKPLVRWTVERTLSAQVEHVVVVVGHEGRAVQDAVAGLAIDCVVNPRYQDGISTSLRAGIESLPQATEAAVVVLGDQPGVTSAILDGLIATYRATRRAIVVPVYEEDTRGNPVLFDAAVFPELRAVSGDQGARDVISRQPDRVAAVMFSYPAPRDVDRRQDYEALLGGPPAGGS
jgi:molybdenum cofactor cytidylyltransferase